MESVDLSSASAEFPDFDVLAVMDNGDSQVIGQKNSALLSAGSIVS